MREWLAKLRGNNSQKSIANKLGMSQQYYNYMENGERQKKMDVQMCERIAKAFGMPIEKIVECELKYERR